MKGILATVICAVAAIYAATVFAENIVKEPEEKKQNNLCSNELVTK